MLNVFTRLTVVFGLRFFVVFKEETYLLENQITPKSSLSEAFEKYKSVKSWSYSTIKAYERNVEEFILDMEEKNVVKTSHMSIH